MFLHERTLQLPVEVETTSLETVQQVLDLGEANLGSVVTRIMLDNMAVRNSSAKGFHASFLPTPNIGQL